MKFSIHSYDNIILSYWKIFYYPVSIIDPSYYSKRRGCLRYRLQCYNVRRCRGYGYNKKCKYVKKCNNVCVRRSYGYYGDESEENDEDG